MVLAPDRSTRGSHSFNRFSRRHELEVPISDGVDHSAPWSHYSVQPRSCWSAADDTGSGTSAGSRAVWNKAATPGLPRNKYRNFRTGHAFGRTMIDDHSRVAYAEIERFHRTLADG